MNRSTRLHGPHSPRAAAAGASLGWAPFVGLALVCAGIVAARPALAEAATSVEHKVKAGFLLNFARYVVWPDQAFATPDTPVCIAVLGDDPFGAFLDETVRGETAGGHGLTVRRTRSAEGVRDCHVVFVSRSEVGHDARHLAALAGRPILTVGEVPGFIQRGGTVNFYLENERVRFEISRLHTERTGLRIHPQLLRLARIVDAGGAGGGRGGGGRCGGGLPASAAGRQPANGRLH